MRSCFRHVSTLRCAGRRRHGRAGHISGGPKFGIRNLEFAIATGNSPRISHILNPEFLIPNSEFLISPTALNLILQKRRDELLCPRPNAPPAPLGPLDLAAPLQVREKRPMQHRRERAVV